MGMVFHKLVHKNNPSLSECHDDFFIQEPENVASRRGHRLDNFEFKLLNHS